MSEYKTIHGIHVQALDTDPSNLGAGQVWYNTTSNQLKITAINSVAWASGGNMATARYYLAGTGTQTAGLAFGGNPTTNATEHYDGSAWTAGGNMGTARKALAGAGTQTTGLAFGGSPGATKNATEHYDGSAWTAGGNMATGRHGLAGAGTQTAGLGFGGYGLINASEYGLINATEHYDGSAWTSGGNMGTARYNPGGTGTLSAGLGFGGTMADFTKTNATEEYAGPGITTQTVTSS